MPLYLHMGQDYQETEECIDINYTDSAIIRFMINEEQPISVKIVVVGDGTVGKTCILMSYTKDEFPTDYVPTVFENYAAAIRVDGRMVNLSLWDTAGQQAYDKLRILAYPNTDAFLVVFSVMEPATFINARKRWCPEIQQHVSNVPKIFVGNKIDLRSPSAKNDIKNGPLTKQYIERVLDEELKCKYMECSALTQAGLKEVFDEALRMVVKSKQKMIRKKQEPKNKCYLI